MRSATQALRRYAKRTPLLRWILAPIIKYRATVVQTRSNTAHQIYANTVRGGTLIVSPENIDGEFLVDARSHLAQRVVVSGTYEPGVIDVLDSLRISNSGVMINIGANIGFIAVYLSKRFPNAPVIAVEPNPEAFKLLQTNVQLNERSGAIECVPVCIGDEDGVVHLATIEGKAEYSSIGGVVHASVSDMAQKTIDVPITRLKKLVGDRPVSFIFMDVEGAEESVFRGAADILVRDKPILYFECADRLLQKFECSSESIENFLVQQGYQVRNGLYPHDRLRHPFDGEALAFVGNDSPCRTV